MKIRVYCLVVCIIWLMSGCALLTKHVDRDDAQDTLQVVEILRYFQSVQQLSAQELHRQYVIQNDRYALQQNEKNRIMLALLLTIPQTKFHDTSRAVEILSASPASRPHDDKSLQKLSSLLVHLLAAQKDQEAHYTAARKQLQSVIEEKNEKERRYQQTSQRLSAMLSKIKRQETLNDQLGQELGKERARVETLQQKIEQLKLIEKSITDRKNHKEPTT